jgi:hypothetical protein
MQLNRSIIFAFAILLFSGCENSHPAITQESALVEMSDWNWFSVRAPTTFQEHILRGDGSVALTTYLTATSERNSQDYSVHLYSSLSSPCSPSLTGASQMNPLLNANAKAEWGRVDLNELMQQEGYIPPYNTDNVKCGGAPNVYAFCSEHEGKTVVICVNEVTDNPALAEEIFKTFKWTK